MAKTKEELMEQAQVVRAWEAACKIEHPSDQERAFRIGLAKKLGIAFGLRELRDTKAFVVAGVTPATPAGGKAKG